jgi:hypothetical protein
MKRRIFTVLLVLGLCVGTASAQFGFVGSSMIRRITRMLCFATINSYSSSLNLSGPANSESVQPGPTRSGVSTPSS